MKKNLILSLSLIALASISLSSCHKPISISAFDIPSELDMNRTYELEFWSKNDGNVMQASIYTETINEFEKL